MLTADEIRKRLEDYNLKQVAKRCGLAYQTVWRFSQAKTPGVNYETAKRLSDFLEGKHNAQ